MDVLMAFLQGLSILVAAVYAFLTYHILKASQAQITATIRPYVYFDIVGGLASVEAVLKNAGKTAAFDVHIEVTPPLRVLIRGDPKLASLTSERLPMLLPDREIREYIEPLLELTQRMQIPVFTGWVKYHDAAGNKYKELFQSKPTALKDMAFIDRPVVAEELKGIVDRLSDIQRSIDNATRREP
jgi:hypothetical protein